MNGIQHKVKSKTKHTNPLQVWCLNARPHGCCTVQSGRYWLTFQRSWLPPSSGRWDNELIWNVGQYLQTKLCNIPEDKHLHSHRRHNLRSDLLMVFCNFFQVVAWQNIVKYLGCHITAKLCTIVLYQISFFLSFFIFYCEYNGKRQPLDSGIMVINILLLATVSVAIPTGTFCGEFVWRNQKLKKCIQSYNSELSWEWKLVSESVEAQRNISL